MDTTEATNRRPGEMLVTHRRTGEQRWMRTTALVEIGYWIDAKGQPLVVMENSIIGDCVDIARLAGAIVPPATMPATWQEPVPAHLTPLDQLIARHDHRLNGMADGAAIVGLFGASSHVLFSADVGLIATVLATSSIVIAMRIPLASRVLLWLVRPLGHNKPEKPAEEHRCADEFERNAER